VRQCELACFGVPLLIAAVVVGLLTSTPALLAGLLISVGAVGTVAVALRKRVASWTYVEREDDLIVGRGVMVRRVTVVPYGRMQFLDVTAGPFERAVGLATVRLHTAAAAGDARIPGLDKEEAGRLRDRLAALGEARAAGL
jgi:membrane protein YdbS with pleckstrin-like domain